jgi:chlorobactene glucosyltransferase
LTASPPLLEILGWTLAAGAVVTTAVWGYVLVLVERSIRAVPTLRHGAALAAADPPGGRVCVVIPAHNEARVIGELVASLRAETWPALAVVLALDRCTDDTAALARAAIGGDARFEIVEISSCPADWAGKVHAVHAGVTRSRGAVDADFLLFADADTIFEPGCVAAALALMRSRSLDLLSLLSTLALKTWFERIVQTACAFELMRQYPLPLANAPVGQRRAFANGQFMLFRRDAYEAIGGHEAVKSALLEDLALAKRIEGAHRNGGVFFAAGLLHCRMYADWAQFRRGWKRIFTEAANRNARRLTVNAWRVRGLGTILPLWTLACGVLGAFALARDPRAGWTLLALWLVATLIWLGALWRVAVIARAPLWTAPLHAVGAWLTGSLLAEAARDLRTGTPTRWGGRDYDVTTGQP